MQYNRRDRSRTPRKASSRVDSRESDFTKLADPIWRMARVEKRTSQAYMNKDIVPEFRPEDPKLTAQPWLNKVNDLASVYNWDSKTTMFLATPKLAGLARTWYNGVERLLGDWQTFSKELLAAFPRQMEFGKLFREAANFTSVNQELETYCIAKLAKIEKLELPIPEDKLVNFVAEGIHNDRTKEVILAARISTVEELKRTIVNLSVTEEKVQSKDKKFNSDGRQQQTSGEGQGSI